MVFGREQKIQRATTERAEANRELCGEITIFPPVLSAVARYRHAEEDSEQLELEEGILVEEMVFGFYCKRNVLSMIAIVGIPIIITTTIIIVVVVIICRTIVITCVGVVIRLGWR